MTAKITDQIPLSKQLQHVVHLCFHILIAITPFIWNPSNSELFEFPKMFFTYAITLLIAGAWVGRMIVEKRLIFKRTFLDIPILIFFISQVISTIFSINLHTSIFGYYSRLNGGLLSLTAYLVLYYSLVSNFNAHQVGKLIRTLIITSILTSLYSFVEHFGASPSCSIIRKKLVWAADCWLQDVVLRVFGTFGQPNWQAAYIVTTIFLPLANVFNQIKKTSKITFSSTMMIASHIFLFTVLLFTKSRSGLMGYALGYITWFTLSLVQTKFFKSPHPNSTRPIPSTIIPSKHQPITSNFHPIPIIFFITFVLVLIASISFGFGIHPKSDQFIKSLQFRSPSTTNTTQSATVSAQITATSNLGGTSSSDIRLIVWKGAIDLWKKHPIIGSGVETFAYAYYNTRPREHNDVSEWDFLYNKAHNEFLNFASTTGTLGLVSYLLVIFTYVIWSISQIFRPNANPYHQPLIWSLIAGFLGLAVSNFFGFSTVAVSTLFFLYPAIAAVLTDSLQPDKINSNTKSSQSISTQLPHLIFLGFIVLASLTILYKWFVADMLYAKGQSALELGDLANSIALLEKATSDMPSEPNYSDQLSLAYSQAALQLHQVNESTAAAYFADRAVTMSNKTMLQNPYHLNYYKNRARVMVALANLNTQYSQNALDTLTTAISLAPTDAKLQYNLGLLYQQLEATDSAQQAFEQAVELKPNYDAARFDLGLLYEQAGEIDKAEAQYQYILEKINPDHLEIIERLSKLKNAKLK